MISYFATAAVALFIGFGVGFKTAYEAVISRPELAKNMHELADLEAEAKALGGRRDWRGRWRWTQAD